MTKRRLYSLCFILALGEARAFGEDHPQPALLPVPATIRAKGLPPVSASLRDELNRYQNIRTASFQDWESSGSAMFITTRFGEVPQVHIVPAPGGARTQLTFLPERVLGVTSRPMHLEFLYSIDEGGAENFQFFLQKLTGGEPLRLTDGKSRNSGAKFSPSGDLLAWSGNARNGRDMDLYVGAPSDPHFVRLLKEVTGSWAVADWSPDETRLVAVEYVSINESYIHVIEVATGKTETITPRRTDPKAEPIAYSSPKWSPDGSGLYYLTDKGSEFQRLVYYELGTGKITPLTEKIAWDVEEFDVSDDGAWLACVVNEKGFSRVYTIRAKDLDFGQPISHSWCDDVQGVISGIEFRPDTYQLGFTISTSQAAADAYSWNVEGPNPEDGIERWTTSETGGLDLTTFAEPELIEYSSFDGRKIPAFVYKPSPSKFPGRRPVLIEIHGGPEAQFRPSFIARRNYMINSLGITVIFPNVRGSAGYGKTYLKLDNGKLREDSVKDIGSLFDWIAAQPDLDAGRVGVSGGSYGGFMSLAVQTTYNSKIKAGIDIVGISNFVTFLKNTQGYRRDLRRAEYGDERDESMRAFMEQIAPLAHADKIHTPILVVQGQNDPRVPISEADQMVAALEKNKTPVWYVIGTNEGHGFAKKANQDYLQAVEVLFLRQYLLGEEKPK
jgi:dipeptidyl aminopeptidase/acylaminoacyl peptidase